MISFNLHEFLRQHWFKLALLALILWVYTQKDFSFVSNKNPKPTPVNTKYSNGGSKNTIAKAEANPSENSPSLFSFFSRPKQNNKEVKAKFETIPNKTILAYIKRFGKVARTEQKNFGVPASITLANALLQSTVGTNETSNATINNHFGLICNNDWQGEMVEVEGQCFRRYATAWESFRDHSVYLEQNFPKCQGKNYLTWSSALGEANDDEAYTLALNEIIERYQLYLLDKK